MAFAKQSRIESAHPSTANDGNQRQYNPDASQTAGGRPTWMSSLYARNFERNVSSSGNASFELKSSNCLGNKEATRKGRASRHEAQWLHAGAVAWPSGCALCTAAPGQPPDGTQTNSRQHVPPVAHAADVFTRAHSRKLLTHTHAMGINEWQPRHSQHNISR